MTEGESNRPAKFLPYLKTITAAVQLQPTIDEVQRAVLFALAEIHDISSDNLATVRELSAMCGHVQMEIVRALNGLTPNVTRKLAIEVDRQPLSKTIGGAKVGFRLKYATISESQKGEIETALKPAPPKSMPAKAAQPNNPPAPEEKTQTKPAQKSTANLEPRKAPASNGRERELNVEAPEEADFSTRKAALPMVKITLPLDGTYFIDRAKEGQRHVCPAIENQHLKIVPPSDPRYTEWRSRLFQLDKYPHVIVEVVDNARQVFIVEERYLDPVLADESQDEDFGLAFFRRQRLLREQAAARKKGHSRKAPQNHK